MSLTIEQVRTKAREHVVAKYRTQMIASKAFGCSVSYLNEVLVGKAEMPDWLLMEIGLARRVVYFELPCPVELAKPAASARNPKDLERIVGV